MNVLRDCMAVDSLDPCGVYFGTTGGQVYVSADAGDRWMPIVSNLPRVLSVEASVDMKDFILEAIQDPDEFMQTYPHSSNVLWKHGSVSLKDYMRLLLSHRMP